LKGPDGPVKFRLDLTQAELASMMGSCQQTISESLKKLEQQGVIEISGKEITILHPSEILEHTYH
jgi:CRP/FNR family transcriptional regulator